MHSRRGSCHSMGQARRRAARNIDRLRSYGRSHRLRASFDDREIGAYLTNLPSTYVAPVGPGSGCRPRLGRWRCSRSGDRRKAPRACAPGACGPRSTAGVFRATGLTVLRRSEAGLRHLERVTPEQLTIAKVLGGRDRELFLVLGLMAIVAERSDAARRHARRRRRSVRARRHR